MAKAKVSLSSFKPKQKRKLGRHKKSRNKHESWKKYVGQGKK
jgi:hypothetical protein